MSPSEVESCLSEIGRLWPRVMSAKGWTKEEKALFAEKAARVHCGQDQAVAAIREYKATVEKFPQVAGLLDRLKRLNPTGTHSPTREHADPAMHPTLAHMVKRLHHEGLPISPSEDPKNIVAHYWGMSCRITADLLGFVPADRFDGIYRDVMELWHDDHERADKAREWLIGKFADRLDPPAQPTNRQVRAQCLRRVTESRVAKTMAMQETSNERAQHVV